MLMVQFLEDLGQLGMAVHHSPLNLMGGQFLEEDGQPEAHFQSFRLFPQLRHDCPGEPSNCGKYPLPRHSGGRL